MLALQLEGLLFYLEVPLALLLATSWPVLELLRRVGNVLRSFRGSAAPAAACDLRLQRGRGERRHEAALLELAQAYLSLNEGFNLKDIGSFAVVQAEKQFLAGARSFMREVEGAIAHDHVCPFSVVAALLALELERCSVPDVTDTHQREPGQLPDFLGLALRTLRIGRSGASLFC
eukprot:TRINITY_DN32805_c0_g1_i1.p1 TRINITY_DN32805_c0_g1~~TRINITY_DN32805_c0_g1_i1.p1  ORF type:complete len:175 (+),score=44.36 TRINITY_DN32805_c0_g1_i1:3-527(+)